MLSFFYGTVITIADEMPPEVKRLTFLKDKKIQEVNKKYWAELNKLKKKYAKSENTRDALYIEKMQIAYLDEQKKLEEAKKPPEDDLEDTLTSYDWKTPKTIWRFNKDGSIESLKTGRKSWWKIKDDEILIGWEEFKIKLPVEKTAEAISKSGRTVNLIRIDKSVN